MTEQNEPSMEDILASIRNILAEDEENNPEQQNVKNDPVVQNVPETPNEKNGVDEQKKTEQVRFDSEVKNTQTEKKSLPDKMLGSTTTEVSEAILNLTADMIVPQSQKEVIQETHPVSEDDEDDFTPEPVIPQEPMKEETLTDLIKETAEHRFNADDSLLAEPTVIAATESLSHLRDIASEKRLHLGKGDMTIEAIVRETLKPYLKEWLDVNLPDIVERVVKKEIAHVMDRLDLK